MFGMLKKEHKIYVESYLDENKNEILNMLYKRKDITQVDDQPKTIISMEYVYDDSDLYIETTNTLSEDDKVWLFPDLYSNCLLFKISRMGLLGDFYTVGHIKLEIPNILNTRPYFDLIVKKFRTWFPNAKYTKTTRANKEIRKLNDYLKSLKRVSPLLCEEEKWNSQNLE